MFLVGTKWKSDRLCHHYYLQIFMCDLMWVVFVTWTLSSEVTVPQVAEYSIRVGGSCFCLNDMNWLFLLTRFTLLQLLNPVSFRQLRPIKDVSRLKQGASGERTSNIWSSCCCTAFKLTLSHSFACSSSVNGGGLVGGLLSSACSSGLKKQSVNMYYAWASWESFPKVLHWDHLG